jgi:integrase
MKESITLTLQRGPTIQASATKSGRRRPSRQFSRIWKLLQECTGRCYIEDIKQVDVTETFVQALRAKEYSRQTIFDRYARIVSFLKFCSKKFACKRVVELGDGPPGPKPKYDVDIGKKDPYTDAELTKLFSVCTDEERLLFAFFLGTGAREKEVIYATWKDLESATSAPSKKSGARAVRAPSGKDEDYFVGT